MKAFSSVLLPGGRGTWRRGNSRSEEERGRKEMMGIWT
jgi:hypothetical protein